MTPPLFPAIKAECLVVLHAPDDTVRVTVDWHDRGESLDLEAFFALAIVQLLIQSKQAGKDPNVILAHVMRLAGAS
jgi:hypothetical protein